MTLAVGCVARLFAAEDSWARSGTAIWLLPFFGYAAVNVLFVPLVPWLGWLGWANLIAVFVIGAGIRAAALWRALSFALGAGGCYQRLGRPDWLMLGRTQVEQ